MAAALRVHIGLERARALLKADEAPDNPADLPIPEAAALLRQESFARANWSRRSLTGLPSATLGSVLS